MHCNAWQSNALKHNTAHYNELVLHCTTFQSKAMQGSAVERARCDASPPCQSPVLIRLKQLCSRNLRKTLPRVTVHPKSSPCIVDLQKDKYKDKDTQTQTKTNTKCFQDPILQCHHQMISFQKIYGLHALHGLEHHTVVLEALCICFCLCLGVFVFVFVFL